MFGSMFQSVPSSNPQAHLGSSDSTGMGLVMECVADAMGWISRQEIILAGAAGSHVCNICDQRVSFRNGVGKEFHMMCLVAIQAC